MSTITDHTSVDDQMADSLGTGSDVYLLKDSSLEDEEEPGVSDSLDGCEEADCAESAQPLTDSQRDSATERCRQQRRNTLVVALAAVVAVFVVAGVVVVVALSVTSLVSQSTQPTVPVDGDTEHDGILTPVSPSIEPSHGPLPTVNIVSTDNCTTSVVGDWDNGVRVFKVRCTIHANYTWTARSPSSYHCVPHKIYLP